MNATNTSAASRSRFALLALDVVLITVFAALGRDTHEHGLDPAGVLLTASPFLAACLAGWALLGRWRSPARIWPAGIILWLFTVAAGLGIRALAGGGVAPSFAVVTLLVLGLFLLLPRAVAALVRRSRRNRQPGQPASAGDRLTDRA
ncbi:DUF3054 domain-containing protein [Arthrobacter sp. zg-ZUI100]|uniref:DUF3054 domain-containing protein n=1 Tax=Arthrobacter jiangjiafuii TaxID=2817475 RepID=UPI001AED7F97|nr:DUF3054 domain-containing protein [Arthrobacter jiangjiafuii]